MTVINASAISQPVSLSSARSKMLLSGNTLSQADALCLARLNKPMLVVDGGAISLTRVRAAFDTPMLNDARLVDPLNYELIAKLVASSGYWLLPPPVIPPRPSASPAPISPHGTMHKYGDGDLTEHLDVQETFLPPGAPLQKAWLDVNGIRLQYDSFIDNGGYGRFHIHTAPGQVVPDLSNGDDVIVHSEGIVEFWGYIGNAPFETTHIDIMLQPPNWGFPGTRPDTGNLTIWRNPPGGSGGWQETYYNVSVVYAGGAQTYGYFTLNGGDVLAKDTLPWYDSGIGYFHQARTPEYGESPIFIPTSASKAAELFHSEIIPERAVYPRWVDIILDTEMTDGGEYELRILPPELGGPVSPEGDGFEIDYAVDFTGIGEKPEVQAVQAVGLNRVDVIFTERMKNNDAIKDPSNYAFDKGLVVKSVLGVDEETVMLATSDQEPGELYTLTVAPVV